MFRVGPRRVANNSKLKYKLVEDKEIPINVAENQLDRFLETLQSLTSCSFCGVTCEGVIVENTV